MRLIQKITIPSATPIFRHPVSADCPNKPAMRQSTSLLDEK
ncbi:hypothetical protein [Clostridium beijerinckii]|nr:hypothetical protein [Clostridium beijerinckii]